MSQIDKCTECSGELHWYAATNEDGWMCCNCQHKPGEPPGFSPQLDRDLLDIKVWGLMHDIANANMIHVSNGSAGDGITASVTEKCRALNRFDQGTITLLIVQGWAEPHAEYWAKISDGIMRGEDPRPRCGGGQLANTFTQGKQFCSECLWCTSERKYAS